MNLEQFEQLEFQHRIGWLLPTFTKLNPAVSTIHASYDECDCSFSNSLKEKVMSLSEEKIEDVEEFKEIFCKEAKLIVNLTDEEIVARRHRLEKIVRNFRTRISKDNDEIAHRKEKMSKAERQKLEELDKSYKVKPVPVEVKEEKKSPFEKALGRQPKSREDKAVATLMEKMDMSLEAAMKFAGVTIK